ncbi:GerMN domain-containing protein [Abiotrophia defectiva]|uniref:GerMN domain-containing protein n=1 Tax=Abiotrophia defectiva TaxID=46125 RepID=UPI0028D339C4|nr:GerMN domain-containing protein [Abiotrophia defectiva]
MKRGILLVGFVLLLSACKQEPMIHISPDVQASIDKKAADRQGTANNSSADTSAGMTEISGEIDTSAWQKAPEATQYDISHYAPNGINQLKEFETSEGTQLVYTDYIDNNRQLWQIRTLLPNGRANVSIYQLTKEGWQISWQALDSLDTTSHLDQVSHTNRIPYLMAPIQVGTMWQDSQGSRSTITNLYQSAKIGDATYEDVIEVTTFRSDQEVHTYYAKDQGLVMSSQKAINSGGENIALTLKSNQHQVSITQSINIAKPSNQMNPILTKGTGKLTWQTNQNPGKTFTELFRKEGWINASVEVKDIKIDSQIATVDFTPGVVAAMNQHTARETAVLPAIVQTIADYYGVSQVKLTVGGLILSPDTLPIPANGIWEVNPSWLGSNP